MSRADRRGARRPRVSALFADGRVDRALDLLDLLEMAWHDCYQEVGPSEDIVDDVLLLSRGSLDGLIRAALLAVTDWRDLKVAAAAARAVEA